MSREYIIPIFIPHAGCKKRCVFCNEYSATGIKKYPDLNELEKEFNRYSSYFKEKNNVYIAFYGSTFTGIKDELMKFYLNWAQKKINDGLVSGIRFSTSPEEINDKKFEILKDFDISVIEVGVQSFFEDVLKSANRPHDLNDVYNAINVLDKYNVKYGLHLMTGLLNSSYEKDIKSAEIASKTKADFFRIHPSVILKNSTLEIMYKKNTYIPESIDRAVEKVAKMTVILEREGKKVIRMGLCLYGDEINNVVAGPYHQSFGDLVRSHIAKLILTKIKFNELSIPMAYKSNFIGYKKSNKKYLINNISFNDEEKFYLDKKEFDYIELLRKINFDS
ncbi:radical SAM protein [Tepiditoga spiralis]|uniref:Radical SAM protein n=1 Tax=Tepiditoga spiralis TaxID=2108365 RepID=A0A7G1G5F8_9BACT|nr:radical SAM protein [Tepiditoga spiralis]BBE30127.1 radical SAM protein [Tepiditoga spiralis]